MGRASRRLKLDVDAPGCGLNNNLSKFSSESEMWLKFGGNLLLLRLLIISVKCVPKSSRVRFELFLLDKHFMMVFTVSEGVDLCLRVWKSFGGNLDGWSSLPQLTSSTKNEGGARLVALEVVASLFHS